MTTTRKLVLVVLAAMAATCAIPALMSAQNIRQLPRTTAVTGANDSALVIVSDSAGTSAAPRTRALSTHELFKRPRGTAGKPSFSSALDSTSGMYMFGADTLGFTTGGTARAYWASTGLIPALGNSFIMGTAVLPWKKVFVGDSLIVSEVSKANRLVAKWSVQPATDFGDTLRLLSNNDTGTPALIRGGAGNFTLLCGTGNSRTCTFQSTTSAGTAKNTLVLGADSSATFLGQIAAMAGAVGTPSLHFGTANTGFYGGSNQVNFALSGVRKFTFTNSGDLEAAASTARFGAENGSANLPSIKFNGSNNYNAGFYFKAGSSPSDTIGIGIDSVGIVKVASGAVNSVVITGKVSVSDTLILSGKATVPSLTAATGTPGTLCYNTTTFEALLNAALTCTVSSRRYKQNIRYLSPLVATRTAMALKPATFEYKNGGRSAFGLIAEEVDSVDARLATKDGQGRVNAVNYEQVTVLLLSLVQQQQKQLATQQKSLDSLTRALKATNAAVAVILNPE